VSTVLPPDVPYKGIVSYDESDAAFFFGREPECRLIVDNILASRFTLLYGASGVGKSSLLRAGVVPRLRELDHLNSDDLGEPGSAVIMYSSWRDDPVEGLKAAVERAVADELRVPAPPARLPGRSLEETIHLSTDRLGGDLVIILDQFEDYFLYHGAEDGSGTLAVELPQAVGNRDLRVSFLVALREDTLALLDRFEGRIPGLFDNYLRVEHLDREAGREAIEGPLVEFNRRCAAAGIHRSASIEPPLVEAVLDQIRTGRVLLGGIGGGAVDHRDGSISQDNADRIETPYLQLVMTRLWTEEVARAAARNGSDHGRSLVLRPDTLDDLGGAERIVRTHLDDTISALSPNDREIAARALYRAYRGRPSLVHGARRGGARPCAPGSFRARDTSSAACGSTHRPPRDSSLRDISRRAGTCGGGLAGTVRP
jgi:hypothetical protein